MGYRVYKTETKFVSVSHEQKARGSQYMVHGVSVSFFLKVYNRMNKIYLTNQKHW